MPSSTKAASMGATVESSEAPWLLPKKPSDPSRTSQAHVLAHAPEARLMRVCYTKGPAESLVAVRANTSGGGNVATNIYLGGCVDIGGTDIEITNPNTEPVSGTYLALADSKS